MKLPQIKKMIVVSFVALLSVYGFGQISGGTGGGGGAPANDTEIKDPNPPIGGPGGVASRATGGPDAYGYTWDDGVPFVGADITGTGTMVFSGDDVSSGPIALGGSGTFMFYGVNYTSLTMASNGYISTDPTDTGPDLSNDCPLPATPSTGGGARIYPEHDDLISDGYYQYFASCPRAADIGGNTGCHVFQWANTTHFGGGGETWNMWVIIYDGTSDIVVQVGPGNPETGSGSTTGIQNDGATIGLTYACDTAGSVPDNSAILFTNPDAPRCEITSMTLNGFNLTITGDCPDGANIYALSNGVYTFVGNVAVNGVAVINVSAYPDSFFCAFADGAVHGVDPPLACTLISTVPTLSQWGLIAFLTLLAGAGLFFIRRRTAVS